MRVVATAGHVDHGKSTLVRALTGTDPDRLEEEHRRGLTIDLGYAWTSLPDGEDLAFVDVPGHQRFIANTLAGIGPAPAVLLVIAADEGWRQQTQEHLDAINALGVKNGLVAVTRSDLADPERAIAEARERLDSKVFREIVPVSAMTGDGLPELRAALARLVDALPEPDRIGRTRMWIDRVFTVRGAGTVVTGTLGNGTVRINDRLQVGTEIASVRSIQALERSEQQVGAVARVALNLRGLATNEIARGEVVVTPDAWHLTHVVDVRIEPEPESLPSELMAHVGTVAVSARVRPLGGAHVRLQWTGDLPLTAGDRLVLRDPGRQEVVGGALLLDVDPPPLTRRGAARARAIELTAYDGRADARRETDRRGFVRLDHLRRLGADPAGLRTVGDHAISEDRWKAWRSAAVKVIDARHRDHPLDPSVPVAALKDAIGAPANDIVIAVARAAELEVVDGGVRRPGTRADLGAADAGLRELEARLRAEPFRAAERAELDTLGLRARELAAAIGLGRLIDLGDQIFLLPTAPALAMRELAALGAPFTAAQAKGALGTTRRVVIPLLEHLDQRGWTRRIDGTLREVRRGNQSL
ncbi:selenocysteine-specific translation elongation factor [Calidifontibacter terrae]